MTDDAKALDEARLKEAKRQAEEWGGPTLDTDRRQFKIYRRLVVEDWQPPVDELEEALRGMCAIPEQFSADLRRRLASRGLVLSRPVEMTEGEIGGAWEAAGYPGNGYAFGFRLAGGQIKESGNG